MRRTIMILVVLVLFATNAWALTKPVASSDYDGTYSGAGTGWIYTVLYRDNYCYQAPINPCIEQGEGEGRGSHPGVDIDCDTGTEVRSIANGIVYDSDYDPDGWGHYIVIQHNIDPIGTIYSAYAHLSQRYVSSGSVSEGDVIGLSGDTGSSTGDHLHFQIDRHTKLDGSATVSYHPYWPSADGLDVNDLDPTHLVELSTINPMPFLQMGSYDPCYVPVGFVLNEDYSGYPTWRTDGLSQAFRDKYDSYVFEGQDTPQHGAIGFPWDNAPDWVSYGQAVHKVDDMWIQDFYGPNNGFNLPYCALIKGDGTSGVYLLKEGFWDYWVNNAGWEVFGYPVTDEYMVGGVSHQTFVKNGQQIVFAWEGGPEPDVEYMSGISANMYNVTFTSLAKAVGDGVYHSGLSVTDFGDPIEMIEGRTYDGFYAMVGGEEELISPFTVTGDMTIIVGVSPPNADFIGSPTSGTVPLFVQFTDQSTGDPTSWSWNFGDGYTSISQDPGHTYSSTGDYTASLTVYNSAGSDSYTRTSYIHVASTITASFSVSSPDGYWKPAQVDFVDTSAGNPTSWAWNFGDGNNSSIQNPSQTYTSSGDYTVSLTVSNGYDSDTSYQVVQIKETVVPNFTSDVTSGPAPLTVQFTDQSTGGTMDMWAWDFGDGGGSCCTTQNPSYTYNTPGVYSVRLDAQNQYDDSQFIIKTNYITVEEPGCTGNGAYHFNGVDQYLTVGVMVGGVLGSETTVEAWVKLDRNNVEQNIYSYWNVDPYKMFNLYVDNTGHLVGERYGTTPSSVVGSTILTVDEWYYVVMVSKHGEPTKVYVNGVLDGTSTAVLDTPNTTSALLGTMAVQNYNGTYINYLEGAIDEVRVSTVARTATEISAYYANGNEMVVDANTMTLWHTNGEAGTADKMAGVTGTILLRNLEERNNPQATSGFNECLPLVADFIANPTSVYTGQQVQFTDQSSGSPTSWSWSFGDGSNSTAQNPAHTYSIYGVYTVSLTVGDGITSDTKTIIGMITVTKYIPPDDDDDVYPHSVPNPSNPLSVIKFKVSQPGHVNLSIFDVQGRRVQVLVDQALDVGVHQATFNGDSFASGIYFYMISSAEGTEVRKITLVK